MDERLCEDVRKYPHLYICSMTKYKDIYMDFNPWREIAQTLAPLGQERYFNLAIMQKMADLTFCLVSSQNIYKFLNQDMFTR